MYIILSHLIDTNDNAHVFTFEGAYTEIKYFYYETQFMMLYDLVY